MIEHTLRAILLPENIQMAYQDQAEAITEAIDILLDVAGADLVALRRKWVCLNPQISSVSIRRCGPDAQHQLPGCGFVYETADV